MNKTERIAVGITVGLLALALIMVLFVRASREKEYQNNNEQRERVVDELKDLKRKAQNTPSASSDTASTTLIASTTLGATTTLSASTTASEDIEAFINSTTALPKPESLENSPF